MSLLDEAMETCVFLDKKRVDDGYGGFTTTWTEGASFKAAITFDTSIEARLAEVQGVHSLYTVTTARGTVLEYGDVFKRSGDGKIFKVTSDGDDKFTPASASLDMRQCAAQEFTLTS